MANFLKIFKKNPFVEVTLGFFFLGVSSWRNFAEKKTLIPCNGQAPAHYGLGFWQEEPGYWT
jgi:hypothetical protein